MYCIFLSIRLFSREEWMWWSRFKNLQAIGYQVPPSSVETGWIPWILTKSEMNLSATNMFLSLEIDSARICLFSGSVATQSQTNSDPTFNMVSSIIYSRTLLLVDLAFEACTFESNSKWKRDFSCISEIIFPRLSLRIGLKSTNATHNIHTLKAFCF